MKRSKSFFSALGAVMLLSILHSTSLYALPTGESRAEMLDASRREILALKRNAIPASSLGEWEDIAESAVFMLFRKTELCRAPMRILVTEDDTITARLYPEGTFVISSALLDYIDAELFETASSSSGRMRNFESEREAMLIPFIAIEASRFALDLPYAAWCRSTEKAKATANELYSARIVYSEEEAIEVDRFSLIILTLAGFESDSYVAWLSRLDSASGITTEASRSLAPYLASFPPIQERISSIAAARENVRKISGEAAGLLSGLRTGTAWQESLSSIDALREVYPSAYYLSRLEAIVLHRYWLSGVNPEDGMLKTFLPIAEEQAPETLSLQTKSATVYPFDRTTPVGDAGVFVRAIESYRRALAMVDDPLLASSYAMMLLWTGNREDRAEAVKVCANAASAETGGSSFTARANYASILFLSRTDTDRALEMMEKLSSEKSFMTGNSAVSGTAGVQAGIPGDSRNLTVNLAAMLLLSGKDAKAKSLMETIKGLNTRAGQMTPISWRHVHVGDSTDDLVYRWGEPTEIFYNYYTENWDYPGLAASVLVASDSSKTERIVRSIRIGPHSPISPGADIRTGDKREAFETAFGKPLWYAEDCAVYAYRGNILSVFYLSGRIRTITAGLQL